MRAGGLKPDISTPEKLKSALLAAGAVSYSKGASGIHFVKALEKLGIADAVVAKLVPPAPAELVGAVVARGAADIGAQQFSELLPVSGIDILGPLPPELQQTIVYGATAFPQSKEREAAQDFVKFLRSEPARKVLRKKGPRAGVIFRAPRDCRVALSRASAPWHPGDQDKTAISEIDAPPASKDLKKRRSYFIRKVYETDPLICFYNWHLG